MNMFNISENARKSFTSLFSNANMDLTSDLAIKRMTNEQRKLLKMHPYSIAKGKDGKWRTYLPDGTRKNNRRQIKKTHYEDLANEVIDYWKEETEKVETIDYMFLELIDVWNSLNVIKKNTIDRHKATYNKHFQSFGKMQIKSITAADVENFIYDQFKQGLTEKSWGRLRTVLGELLRHAKKQGLTDLRLSDILEDMEYPPSKLMQKPEQGIKQKAYTLEESQKVLQYCKEHRDNKFCLAIALLFYTGLRVGEVCTLKNSDINTDEMTITISRALEHHKENGHVVYGVQETKTDAGNRTIFIPEGCEWILQELRYLNPFGEYIFANNNKPITDASIRDKLKYICNNIGIPYRSPHKIRKTYGTNLIDSGLSGKFIQQQMGHKEFSTTQKYYYQSIAGKKDKQQMINNVEAFKGLA